MSKLHAEADPPGVLGSEPHPRTSCPARPDCFPGVLPDLGPESETPGSKPVPPDAV